MCHPVTLAAVVVLLAQSVIAIKCYDNSFNSSMVNDNSSVKDCSTGRCLEICEINKVNGTEEFKQGCYDQGIIRTSLTLKTCNNSEEAVCDANLGNGSFVVLECCCNFNDMCNNVSSAQGYAQQYRASQNKTDKAPPPKPISTNTTETKTNSTPAETNVPELITGQPGPFPVGPKFIEIVIPNYDGAVRVVRDGHLHWYIAVAYFIRAAFGSQVL